MSVNVNRGLTDQFYRYKMPKLLAKVEGKGNGIKTVIVNMVEIAKALNRPPMYPTKYFGCILGAQVNYDNKNDRYIVNGAHEAYKLQDLLDGFIQKYVLCPSCANPETVLKVKKSVISTSCKACGFTGTISTQDKLTTYILKYPPESDSKSAEDKKAEKGKSAKKDRSKKKDTKNGDANGSSSPKHDSDGNEGNGHNGVDEDDDDWCEDTDADAVAKRMEGLLSVGAKGLMHTNDLDKTTEERLQILLHFIQKKKQSCPESFDVVAQKDIVAEANRLEVKDKAVLALCEELFDENILSQMKVHRLLLLRFTNENARAQKYLLRGIELTIKCFKKDLVPKVAHILKALYDLDILEEKTILDWGAKPSKKTVGKELAEEIHGRAAPFLKWLKEAEEEESSDGGEEEDEEEDDVDVHFNDRVIGTKIVTQTQESPKKSTAPQEAADDIDIDAI